MHTDEKASRWSEKKRNWFKGKQKQNNISSSWWSGSETIVLVLLIPIQQHCEMSTKTHLQTTRQDTPLAFLQRFLEYKNQRRTLIPPRVLNDEEEAEPFTLNIFDFDGTLFRSPEPNPMLWSKDTLGKLLSTPHQQGNAPPLHFAETLTEPFLTTNLW